MDTRRPTAQDWADDRERRRLGAEQEAAEERRTRAFVRDFARKYPGAFRAPVEDDDA
jgi:hypothetical protein